MLETSAATSAVTPDDVRERRRARRVAYGVVAVLLLVAAVQLELWPLTAYRLFSTVRTSSSTALQLVAVSTDGTRTPVRLDAGNPVLVLTSHQYGDLRSASPPQQRAMALAWLRAAHVDPAGVADVRLERVAQTMDPTTLAWHDTSRKLVVEVPL